MTPITYLQGDATSPQAGGNKLIVHVCNDAGGWGKGFVLALSTRWPQPEKTYRAWYRERAQNDFALGAAQFVPVQPDTCVANVIGQHGIKTSRSGPPVRYDAIARGLAEVAQKALELNATVHMPRIGCGLAGGQWETIEPIIRRELSEHGLAAFVYDFA